MGTSGTLGTSGTRNALTIANYYLLVRFFAGSSDLTYLTYLTYPTYPTYPTYLLLSSAEHLRQLQPEVLRLRRLEQIAVVA